MHDSTLKNSLLALCFVLFSTVAQAAKLGDITVLSAQGQPLNAEIVLIPANQEELAGISARLAAAEVFAEQDLAMAPELASVRAVVAIRADGQPVVQLFSTEPINTAALNMLIQVDSSAGGSFVRKYTVALEAAAAPAAPEQVALPDAPLLPAPEEAMMEPAEAMEAVPEEVMADAMTEETIQEEVMEEHEATIEEMTADVTGIEAPEDEPSPFDEDADLTIDDMQAQDMTDPLPDEPEETMAEMADDDMTADDMQAQDMTEVEGLEQALAEEIAETEPTPEELASMTAEIYNPENPVEAPPAASSNYTVEKGDTLHKIATQQWHEDVSLEQMMAGIYGANPQAFVKGDPNRLKVGAILRVPSAEELKAIDQAEANNVVHANNWNAYRSRLADTVAKAAPVQEGESSPVASGKIATVRDQAEAMHGPRDVVKLSGDAGNATGSKMSKAAMEEELAARENALRESNERIALLEKQLSDANALLEAQKKAVDAATMAGGSATGAEAGKPKSGMIATLQENLQKHPDWKAKGLAAVAVLVALGLILRTRRKEGGTPKKPDAPTAEIGGEALTELSPEAAAEEVATDIAAEAASQPVEEETLGVADLDILLPDDEPEPAPVAEASVEEPAPQEASADELIADMMAASDAVETAEPLVEQTQTSGDDFDDVFDSETALAEMAAELPEASEPAAVDEMADEAATDMMAATAMESGSVEADDQFALDDVFAEAAAPVVADSAPTESAAVPMEETAPTDNFDDVFDSETALAEMAAELPEVAEPASVDAMADEAATDMMTAAAMESGNVEADDQFALDDVFGEATPAAEAPPTEIAMDMPPADGDHSAALASAFEETAKEDLSGLDFGFAMDAEEEVAAAAPIAKAKTKKAAAKPKPKAKKAAAEPEVKLDLSGIDLDVSKENPSVDSADVETKLDLVAAYMDMGDEDGAREILQEVIKEGSASQIAKAQKLLDGLG